MPVGVRRSLGYFALFTTAGLDMAMLGPTLPNLASQTGSSLGEIGLVFFLGALGVSIGTLLGGGILGRVSGRAFLGVCQIVSGSLLLLVPHVGWFVPLLALFAVKGIAGGIVGTSSNTLLQWVHGSKAGPYVNALHFFWGLGAFLSPLLLGLLLTIGARYSDAYTLLAIFDVSVGVAVLLWLSPPSAPPAHALSGSGVAVRTARLGPIVIAAMVFLFFYVSGEITFGGWLSTYAVKLGLADGARAAFLTSMFWLSFTLGRLASIPIALRFTSAQILAAALVGCAVFLSLLVAFPGSPEVLWISAIGLGVSLAPIWPNGFNLAVQSIRLTAGVGAVILMGDSIGAMVLPGLTGLVIERAGASAMTVLVLVSIACTAAAFVAILIVRARWSRGPGSLRVGPAAGSEPQP
jgi:FHS family Na+ dependent glucose MFS transporter 1